MIHRKVLSVFAALLLLAWSLSLAFGAGEGTAGLLRVGAVTGAPGWVLPGATWEIDFANNRSYVKGVTGLAAPPIAITRASASNGLSLSGLWSPFGSGSAVITDLGVQSEPSRTNVVVRDRDLTNASWVKTNVSAFKDQVGIDGVANAASRIKITADGGTISEAITDASRARFESVFVGRISGTGTLEASMDGGATYTDVTPASGEVLRFTIPTQTLANPTEVFRGQTANDEFYIDVVQLENSGTNASSPIYTVGSAVVRAADVITVPDTSPIQLASGAFVVEWEEVAGPIGVARTLAELRVGSNDFIALNVTSGNLAQLQVRRTSDQANVSSTGQVAVGGVYQAAFRYGTSDFAVAFSASLYPSGIQVVSSGSPPSGAFTFGIGQNGASASQGQDRIRSIAWIPAASASNNALLAFANATPAPPITFATGETFSPPSGLSWPASRNGEAIPQTTFWNGSKFATSGDPTSFVSSAIWSAVPYYVDVSMPNDTGNGLTAATAKKYISSAVLLANADAQSAERFIVAGGDYPQVASMNGLSGTQPTKAAGFVATGRVRQFAGTEDAFPLTTDPTFTNSYVGGPPTAVRAFDRLSLDNKGLYTEIPILGSQAAVNAASGGGIFNAASVTTIRRADGLRPTLANTLICGNFDTAFFDNDASDLYFGGGVGVDDAAIGFTFECGIDGGLAIRKIPAVRNVVIDHAFMGYSGSDSNLWDAFRLQGTDGFVLVKDSEASKGYKDGFSPHGTGGVVSDIMYLNPVGWYNGKAPATSDNYLTGHEDTTAWISGGQGGFSIGGPDVHYIDQTKTYIVGNQSSATVTGGVDPTAYKATTSAQMWLEKDTATSTGKSLSVVGGVDPAKAVIYTRGNRIVSGVQSALSGGTIVPF